MCGQMEIGSRFVRHATEPPVRREAEDKCRDTSCRRRHGGTPLDFRVLARAVTHRRRRSLAFTPCREITYSLDTPAITERPVST